MHTEIVKQINQLPPAERVEIIEEVSRVLRREMYRSAHSPISEQERERRREAIEKSSRHRERTRQTSPNDEEVQESYAEYLAEKYK